MIRLFVSMILLSVVATTSAAVSNEAGDMGTIYCGQKGRSFARTMAVLKQVGKYDYTLEVTKTGPPRGKQVLLSTKVRAFQSDVVLTFRNVKDKVTVRIYLDELDQSSLSAPGLDLDLICDIRGPRK